VGDGVPGRVLFYGGTVGETWSRSTEIEAIYNDGVCSAIQIQVVYTSSERALSSDW
jgi:hypothetical protein